MLMAGYHVPAGSHADAAPVDVLTEVLTNSPSGRLYKALVDTKLVSSVINIPDLQHFHDPGILLVFFEVRQSQNLDSARIAFERAIDVARKDTYTADEIQRAKTKLLKDIELGLNNSEQSAIFLSEWQAMGDWRLQFIHRDRIERVTPADVQRVAAAYLKPDNRTTGYFVATAQPDRSDIPATPNVATLVADYKGRAVVQAGEAFDASPKNIEARTKHSALPNGMHLSLLPKLTRGNQVVATLLLRHGTEQSLTNKGEIASLTSAMISRGTTSLTRQQIQDSLDKLKAQVFIGGATNNTQVSIQTTRPNLVPVLELVAHQLKNPRFDPEELDKLKKERLAGIEGAKSQPQTQAIIALNRKLYPLPKGHPMYASSPEESIGEINAVTVDDLKAFHQTFYGASFADLGVIGDFDANEVTAAATKLFGDWKNPQPFERMVRKYAKSDSTFISIETPDKANAFFFAGQTVELSDNDPDYPALNFASYLLGGSGMSSRITDRLRQKEGLSYGAGAGLAVQSLDRYGTWTANAIYAPQNVERLQRAFREEIDRALKDGFTAEEINKFRPGYLEGRSQGRANDNELVGLVIARRFAGRSLAWDEDFEKKIAALTPDQVNAALRKYIDPKKIIIVRAGDFAKNPPVKATP
jgi:zinc protease